MSRLFPVVFAMFLLGCGSSGDTTGPGTTPPPPSPGVVTSVTISGAFIMSAGTQASFSATAHDGSGALVLGKTATWASNNQSVLTVSSQGLVTAVSAGTATVTATVDGVVGATTVTVTPPPAVASLVVTIADDTTYLPGMLLPLVVIVRDANGNRLQRPVTLTTSNPAVVTAGNGARSVGAGTALLTVSVEGFSASVTVKVHDGALIPITGGLANGFGGAVSVQVPAGSLTDPLPLVLNPTVVGAMPAGFATGTGYDAIPASAQLDVAATVKIVVPSAAFAASGHPENLRLHRWDGTSWVAVPGSTIDLGSRTVTGASKVLGSFAVIEVN